MANSARVGRSLTASSSLNPNDLTSISLSHAKLNGLANADAGNISYEIVDELTSAVDDSLDAVREILAAQDRAGLLPIHHTFPSIFRANTAQINKQHPIQQAQIAISGSRERVQYRYWLL